MSTRKRNPHTDRTDEATLISVSRVVPAPGAAAEMPRGDMEDLSFAAVLARAGGGMPPGEMEGAPAGAGGMPDGAMDGGGMPGHAFAAGVGGMPGEAAFGGGEMPGQAGPFARAEMPGEDGGGEMPGPSLAAGMGGAPGAAPETAGLEIGGEWRLVLTTDYARSRAGG